MTVRIHSSNDDSLHIAELSQRYASIMQRISAVEVQLGADPLKQLQRRQVSILERVAALEHQLGVTDLSADDASRSGPAPCPPDESANFRRMHAELLRRGIVDFRLVRVPGPYYERPLAFRAARLRAASEHHLCKTMVMENTRAPPHITDCSNPRLSKYYMVLVQYSAAINAEKLKRFVVEIANTVEPLARSKVNMRMVDESLSCEMTGFGHNAVTPLCSKTRIPIIMSHRIAELSGHFFLGAGEVDLKVGMHAGDFVRAFEDWPVFVIDCTM